MPDAYGHASGQVVNRVKNDLRIIGAPQCPECPPEAGCPNNDCPCCGDGCSPLLCLRTPSHVHRFRALCSAQSVLTLRAQMGSETHFCSRGILTLRSIRQVNLHMGVVLIWSVGYMFQDVGTEGAGPGHSLRLPLGILGRP